MSLVSTHLEGRVAIVTIDNPPVSTGNARLRADLRRTFTELQARADVDAVIVESAQAHFYSGSDIAEFDGEIPPPSLPEVIALVDGMDVPVVAALNGLTLGGGLEFALACDVRIAATDAKVGLPEVTLGMLPGAGGTVRLPRLVGIPAAIRIVTSGKPLRASEALAIGLVDQVVDATELSAAARAAAALASKRRLRLMPVPLADPAEVSTALEKAKKGGRARPNVLRAADLILQGASLDGDAALRGEREVFDELRLSDEARNLRYLFFAKRSAAKDLAVAPGRALASIGVAGAGTMGSRIASALLSAGIDVTVYEVSDDVSARAADNLAVAGTGARRRGALTLTDSFDDLASVDLLIDAVFEDMDVKQRLFIEAERVLRPDAILASNTSYLDLNEIAEALSGRGRFVGVHFFNPADRNPLLEVIRTRWTDDETLGAVSSLVKRLSKTPIVAEVSDGFVANRVYADYRAQAEYLVEDGAYPEDVDDAMRAFGLPMGPFAVADMSGLDIAWSRRKRLAPSRDPRQRYVTIADSLCEAGRLGQKTGAGWYRYDDAPRWAKDSFVRDLVIAARASKGISPRDITPAEIQQRILCSMVVAAAGLVRSGVARRASDVDVAMTEGFAFPRWLGGPLRFVSMQALEWVRDGLRLVYESDPIGFAAAQLSETGELPIAIAEVLAEVRP